MKITTVIPAFKSQYLIQLLTALVHQTVPPDKVIFSDDSPNQDFFRILASNSIKEMVAHLNIEVIVGPHKGAFANGRQCIEVWNQETELLHMLCDDDIIYPHFYESHKRAHMSGNFSSSVSRRWYANENGHPLSRALPVPEIIANHSQKMLSLDANILFWTTVAQGKNWLGEVSNTVMRKETASLVASRIYGDIAFCGLEDLGAFVCGAISNPICYINEHLGYFRLNDGQNSAQTMGMPIKLAYLAYIALAIIGRNAGLISAVQTKSVIDLVGPAFMWYFKNEDDVDELRILLPGLISAETGAEERFLKSWGKFS